MSWWLAGQTRIGSEVVAGWITVWGAGLANDWIVTNWQIRTWQLMDKLVVVWEWLWAVVAGRVDSGRELDQYLAR